MTVKDNALSLNLNEMQLSTKGTGSSIKLVPTIVGANKKVTWETSDKTTATVKGGKVTGKKTGDVDITARANGVSAKCHVKVEEGLISINEEHVKLYVTENDGETKKLKTNASRNDTISWSSSNDKIAEVDNSGVVTAKVQEQLISLLHVAKKQILVWLKWQTQQHQLQKESFI